MKIKLPNMKRKWIWALAVVPLIAGLVLAKRLADKRPRLVAHLKTSVPVGGGTSRAIHATNLFISPDGSRLFVRYLGEGFGDGVALTTGSVSRMPDPDIQHDVLFSADGRHFYHLDSCRFDVSAKQDHRCQALSLFDARSGVLQKQFVIPKTAHVAYKNFYGTALAQGQLVLEGRGHTWRLDPNDLRVVGVYPNQHTLRMGHFCSDGKTLSLLQINRANNALTAQFFDLQSEKLLWQMPLEENWKFATSSDGRIALSLEHRVVISRDLRTGAEKWRLPGPQSHVLAVAPDQSAIYEARANGELWKWPR